MLTNICWTLKCHDTVTNYHINVFPWTLSSVQCLQWWYSIQYHTQKVGFPQALETVNACYRCKLLQTELPEKTLKFFLALNCSNIIYYCGPQSFVKVWHAILWRVIRPPAFTHEQLLDFTASHFVLKKKNEYKNQVF